METSNQASGPRTRGLLLIALVALAGVASAAFGRVFEGSAPAARLVAASAAALVVAAAFSRRSLLTSLAATALALFWVLGLLVYRETLWWGLPSLDTFEALRRVAGHIGEDAIREVAPAPALDSLMTASLIAVWTAATASHALAVRSHSAILAILPPVALVAFADMVVEDGPRPGYALAFLLSAIAVLFGAGLARLEVWGPLVRPEGARGGLGGTGIPGRWAARLALGAAAVALVAPGILPGFGGPPFVQIEPSRGVAVSPVVDIRPALLRNPAATLFYVEAERPVYWRLLSLDRFTGEVWTSTNLGSLSGRPLSGSAELHASPVPGSMEVVQDYEIAELSQPWMPAAFEPSRVELDPAEEPGLVLHDEDTEALSRKILTHPGLRYRVTSRVARPDPGALDEAFIGRSLAPWARYLELPEDLPPRIRTLARQIAGQASTPYRKVLAIQDHLRTFTYDEQAPPGHGSNHILNFLEETQTGFCEQFAGTMAVLIRSLGYPARVAVGFLPGDLGEDGRWVVTTEHVHAWVEVLFPGYGWLAFEPTPRGDNPVNPLYLHPDDSPSAQTTGPLPSEFRLTGEAGESPGSRQRDQNEIRARSTGPLPGPGRRPTEPQTPWVRLALAILALAATMAVGIPAGKALGGRLAVRRARSPAERVTAAWRFFEVRATDLGLGRRAGETVSEYRGRLRRTVAFSDGHLERITTAAGRAFYARDGIGPSEAEEAGRSVGPLLRDLGRHVGPGRRALGAVRPSWPG
jgi:transglutaminase-like putative cysteine protease